MAEVEDVDSVEDTGICYLCDAYGIPEDCYCFGCDEYICDNCDFNYSLIGTHSPLEHEYTEEDE